MTGLRSTQTGLFHIPVQGILFDSGQFLDLPEGVGVGSVELSGLFQLPGVTGRTAAGSPSGPGCVQTFPGALCDHIPLELCNGAHEREQQLACRGAGVDLFLEADQMNAFLLEQLDQFDQVFGAAPQTG